MSLDTGRAREKLLRKGADAIVLNDISKAGVGFDSDRNAAVFLTKTAQEYLAESSKEDIAFQILDQIASLRSRTLIAQTVN